MNLTSVSAFIRKFSKYLLIFIIAYYSWILVIFPGSKGLFKAIFVKKIPPNTVYGLLDPLDFIEKPIGQTKPTYVLNTKDGKLPTTVPEKMDVYAFKPQQYSYLAGKNAIAEAVTLGFADKDLISDLKGDTYVWRNSLTGSILTLQIETRVLNLDTNLSGRNIDFTPGSINTDTAIEFAKKIFTSIGRLDDPLYQQGAQSVRLGSFLGNKLYETTDTREAQVALVDFYRTVNGFVILGPDPSKGLLRAIVREPSNEAYPMNNPFIEAYYWELETPAKASYPIISVKEAWDAVKNARGVITRVVPRGANPFDSYIPVEVQKILIDNIFLAYYETPKYQKYLQPVYVFSGTYSTTGTNGGDITVYFPAITGQQIKQAAPKTTTQ
jgi:hypothetical protein